VNRVQAADSYLQSLCIQKSFIFLKYEYETRFSKKDTLIVCYINKRYINDRVFLKKSQIGTSEDQNQPESLGDIIPAPQSFKIYVKIIRSRDSIH